MSRYVYDSFAVIAFFKGEAGSFKLEELFAAASYEHYITTINVGEVFYIEAKQSDLYRAEELLEDLYKLPLQLVGADFALVMQAAHFKARYPLSYADCFAAALAHRLDATLVTGDPEFEKIEDVVAIEWLPMKPRRRR